LLTIEIVVAHLAMAWCSLPRSRAILERDIIVPAQTLCLAMVILFHGTDLCLQLPCIRSSILIKITEVVSDWPSLFRPFLSGRQSSKAVIVLLLPRPLIHHNLSFRRCFSRLGLRLQLQREEGKASVQREEGGHQWSISIFNGCTYLRLCYWRLAGYLDHAIFEYFSKLGPDFSVQRPGSEQSPRKSHRIHF
jgi:hypothetical protein